MNEINIGQATALTSPDPLVLVCTKKEDGKLNMAPLSFFMYASFNPPMLAFAMGKAANSGENIRRTGKAVLAAPGVSLKEPTAAPTAAKRTNWPKRLLPCRALRGRIFRSLKIAALPLRSRWRKLWNPAIIICTSATSTRCLPTKAKKRYLLGTDTLRSLPQKKKSNFPFYSIRGTLLHDGKRKKSRRTTDDLTHPFETAALIFRVAVFLCHASG